MKTGCSFSAHRAYRRLWRCSGRLSGWGWRWFHAGPAAKRPTIKSTASSMISRRLGCFHRNMNLTETTCRADGVILSPQPLAGSTPGTSRSSWCLEHPRSDCNLHTPGTTGSGSDLSPRMRSRTGARKLRPVRRSTRPPVKTREMIMTTSNYGIINRHGGVKLHRIYFSRRVSRLTRYCSYLINVMMKTYTVYCSKLTALFRCLSHYDN